MTLMMEAEMVSETLSFGASVTRMIARKYFGEFLLRGFSFNGPTASTASLSKVCVCVCVVCVCARAWGVCGVCGCVWCVWVWVCGGGVWMVGFNGERL